MIEKDPPCLKKTSTKYLIRKTTDKNLQRFPFWDQNMHDAELYVTWKNEPTDRVTT